MQRFKNECKDDKTVNKRDNSARL